MAILYELYAIELYKFNLQAEANQYHLHVLSD